MDHIILLFLALSQLPFLYSTAEITHHIVPTPHSPCPNQRCHTFLEVVSNTSEYFKMETHLLFLPGQHVLNASILILTDCASVSFQGSTSYEVTIHCLESSIVLLNVSHIAISGLTFQSCGIANAQTNFSDPKYQRFSSIVTESVGEAIPAISAVFVSNMNLSHCTMKGNIQPMFSYNSTLVLESSMFTGNQGGNGGALMTRLSLVQLRGRNEFANNNASKSGGAINAQKSMLVFAGDIDFVNNNAQVSGGGIAASDSIIEFKSINTDTILSISFVQNSASIRGGGMSMESCKLNHTTTVFLYCRKNFVYLHGGGIWSSHSQISLGPGSAIILESNVAAIGLGGGIHFNSCPSVSISLRCMANSANAGGGVYSDKTFLRIEGNTVFSNNSARGRLSLPAELIDSPALLFSSFEDVGGGSFFSDSKVLFSGPGVFDGNSASKRGGAVYSLGSSVTFQDWNQSNSHNIFRHNRAKIVGGSMMTAFTKMVFDTKTTFAMNSAGNFCGSIFVNQFSRVLFTESTEFLNNSAKYGGGLCLGREAHVTFEGTQEHIFQGNSADNSGGCIELFENTTFHLFGKGKFIGNKAGVSGGVFDSWESGSLVQLEGEGQFSLNSATFGGVISLKLGMAEITGNFNFTTNEGYYGGAIFADDSNVSLSGVQTFLGNVAERDGFGGYGGAIHALRSKLEIKGNLSFIDNVAGYGGGIVISRYAQPHLVYIRENTVIAFHRNHAQYHGGGIAVEDSSSMDCASYAHSSLNNRRVCFFQLEDEYECIVAYGDLTPTKDLRQHNAHMIFEDNTAKKGGNDLHGGNLETCQVCYGQDFQTLYGDLVFSVLTGVCLEEFSGKSTIASEPFRVCPCSSQQEPLCNLTTTSFSVYPGETIPVSLVAVGQLNGTVPGVIHAQFENPKEAFLGELQSTQSLNQSCNALQYTLKKGVQTNVNLSLFAEGPCGALGYPLTISFHFLSCPSGFSLAPSGVCGCEQRLQRYTNSCDIDSQMIVRDGDFWVGYSNQLHGLILHPYCPFDYCKEGIVSFTLEAHDEQCALGRSGMLCGACKTGLSLNLGSSRCSKCSNAFLSLFLLFAIAGFVLVLFLFIFRVTIAAGTLSGLIFYGNVISINKSLFFSSEETNVLTVFIAWVNLDLGIEFCLFNGMDAYARAWLQFVFPLYIWSLVGLIAFVSYYSMTVARIIGPTNPVAVLANLFLLSYTKLIRTIISTFAFTTLDYPNGTAAVWVYDGSIRYFGAKHAFLFLAGLLAFLFLFLPYTLLLLFGQCIVSGSNYRILKWANNPKVRSFLDAYHAPYKNKHRYWVGLLLLLRLFLFTVSAVIDIQTPRDPSVNLLVLILTCTGLLVWIWNVGNTYKATYNNVLESTFLLNLIVLSASSYQVKVEEGSKDGVIYSSVSIAFITFLGIITCHVIQRVQSTVYWRSTIAPALKDWYLKRKESGVDTELAVREEPPRQLRPVTTTFIDLRETLLQSQ